MIDGVAFPDPPEEFTAGQCEVWRDAVRRIPGTLNATKLELLEAYAVERARWREAEAELRANGVVLTLRNDKGEVTKIIPAPQIAIADRAQKRALALAKALRLRG